MSHISTLLCTNWKFTQCILNIHSSSWCSKVFSPTCEMSTTGSESSVASTWSSWRIGFCCWMNVGFEANCSTFVNSWKSFSLLPAPYTLRLSPPCKENTLRRFKASTDNCILCCSQGIFYLKEWSRMRGKGYSACKVSESLDALFVMNTTLPLAVSTVKACREALLPVRFATGCVAGHRVSRIWDIVSVSEL